MKTRIVCSNKIKKVLLDILNLREISITNDAEIYLIEKGYPIAEQGISIIFDPLNLSSLIDFLDIFCKGPQSSEGEFLVGKKKGGFELIKVNEIIYFEAENNYIYCYTINNRFEIKKKLYEIESILSSKGFIRISKSVLVNIIMVHEIFPWFGGRLLLKFKEIANEVEVSRSNVQSFKKFLDM